jgi:hypothetical protein
MSLLETVPNGLSTLKHSEGQQLWKCTKFVRHFTKKSLLIWYNIMLRIC